VLSYLSFLLPSIIFLHHLVSTTLLCFFLNSSWPCKTFSWPCKTSHPICFLCFCFCGRPYIRIHWYRVSSPSFPVATQLIFSFLVYPSWAVTILSYHHDATSNIMPWLQTKYLTLEPPSVGFFKSASYSESMASKSTIWRSLFCCSFICERSM